jgi:hypothetical protein
MEELTDRELVLAYFRRWQEVILQRLSIRVCQSRQQQPLEPSALPSPPSLHPDGRR